MAQAMGGATESVRAATRRPMDSERGLRVFISYSRADMAFADEIAAGLEYDARFEVSIDRNDIHEGEDWKARLGALIADADTVVFILSHKSATSPICTWEVEESERLSKRIIPVQSSPLAGARPPRQLAALNYVRFDAQDDGRPRSFMAGLAGLRRALTADIVWLREHTRLLTRAREWEAADRAENRLLVGRDIGAAKAWLEAWPKDAPAPTELHRDFIATSEQAEAARTSAERKRAEVLQRAVRRTRWALVGSLALTLAAGLAGFFAIQSRQIAVASERHLRNLNGLILLATSKETLPGKELRDVAALFRSIVNQKKAVGFSILWADDHPESNLPIIGILEGLDVSVVQVKSTDDAVSALAKQSFDLILSDMSRGENGVYNGLAGYELLSRARAATAVNVPFIIYSSSSRPEHIEETRRRGGTDQVNEGFALYRASLQSIAGKPAEK